MTRQEKIDELRSIIREAEAQLEALEADPSLHDLPDLDERAVPRSLDHSIG